MRRPLLSVILTAWQAEDTVERAVASVRASHDAPWELIVVDDASTDATRERVAAIAELDARIRLIALPENVGVSAARNAGLAVATGGWLTFLDADDRMPDGAIEALLAPTTDPAVRVVVGQRVWTDGQRRWISSLYDRPDITTPGRKSLVTHPGLLYYASVTGKAFHHSIAQDLTFSGRVLGDQPWAIRAMLRAGDGIEVIGDVVYEWWRPSTQDAAGTITTRTRASATRSAESARTAADAVRAVAREADAQLSDPADRLRLVAAYGERLVRSDFEKALRNAVDRRDPGLAEFLDALTGLVGALPAGVLAASPGTGVALVRPVWRAWPGLGHEERRRAWELVTALRAGDPRIVERLLGSRRLVPALDAAMRIGRTHPVLAARGSSLVHALAAWLRDRRRHARQEAAAQRG